MIRAASSVPGGLEAAEERLLRWLSRPRSARPRLTGLNTPCAVRFEGSRLVVMEIAASPVSPGVLGTQRAGRGSPPSSAMSICVTSSARARCPEAHHQAARQAGASLPPRCVADKPATESRCAAGSSKRRRCQSRRWRCRPGASAARGGTDSVSAPVIPGAVDPPLPLPATVQLPPPEQRWRRRRVVAGRAPKRS